MTKLYDYAIICKAQKLMFLKKYFFLMFKIIN
jgi:hypothetical protein